MGLDVELQHMIGVALNVFDLFNFSLIFLFRFLKVSIVTKLLHPVLFTCSSTFTSF